MRQLREAALVLTGRILTRNHSIDVLHRRQDAWRLPCICVKTVLLIIVLLSTQVTARASEDPLADMFGADGSTMSKKPKKTAASSTKTLHRRKHRWLPWHTKQERAYAKAQTAAAAQGSTDMYGHALWGTLGPFSNNINKPTGGKKKKRKWWHAL